MFLFFFNMRGIKMTLFNSWLKTTCLTLGSLTGFIRWLALRIISELQISAEKTGCTVRTVTTKKMLQPWVTVLWQVCSNSYVESESSHWQHWAESTLGPYYPAFFTQTCVMKHHPEVLMLLLKRFEFDYHWMTNVKINCPVDIACTLQIPEVREQ